MPQTETSFHFLQPLKVLFTGFTNIPQYPENDTTSRSYEKPILGLSLVQISFFPSPFTPYPPLG